MRNWIAAIAVIFALSLTAGVAQAKGGKKARPISGSIVSVAADGGSLVLQTKGKKGAGGEQKTIAIAPTTSIEINNVGGKKASDLHGGMKVKITLANGSASQIVVGAKHTKKVK